jgi:hypothetical protein
MIDTLHEEWGELAAAKRNNFERALAAFHKAQPDAHKLMRTYIEVGRGIPYTNEAKDLRLCPSFYHSELFGTAPAMLAAMRGAPDGEIVAIHATFLRADGLGKADVQPARKVFGKAGGAAVWLTTPGPIMVVTESIEKSLAIYAATSAPVVSAYSMSNVPKINPPPDCKLWTIGADRGDAAEEYARAAGRRLTEEARNARH